MKKLKRKENKWFLNKKITFICGLYYFNKSLGYS